MQGGGQQTAVPSTDPRLAYLNHLQNAPQSVNMTGGSSETLLVPPNSSTEEPFSSGIRSAIHAAKTSLDMTDKQRNKALRRSLLTFGQNMTRVPRQKGFGQNAGTVARALLPAIAEYDTAEAETEAANAAALERKTQRDEQARRYRESLALRLSQRDLAERRFEEEKRMHDFQMQQSKPQESENISPLSDQFAPIESKIERTAYSKVKQSTGEVLGDLNKIKSRFQDLIKLTEDDVISPMNPYVGSYANSVKDMLTYVGYGGKNERKKSVKRRAFEAEVDKFRVEFERKLKGGVLGKGIIEYFDQKNLMPSMQDAPDVFEAKVADLEEMISNRFEAADQSLRHNLHISPYDLSNLQEGSHAMKGVMPEARPEMSTEEDELTTVLMQNGAGQVFRVPSNMIQKALHDEEEPYEIQPEVFKKLSQKKGDSWPALIGKSALKGATAIGDLPRFTEEVIAYPRNMLAKYFNAPSLEYTPKIPTTSDARGFIKKHTGVDLEPHPSTAGQRITSVATEFASPGGIFGALTKAGKAARAISAAKSAGAGAAIGGASGALQEAGVDPLVADVTAIVAPYGVIKGASKIGKISKSLLPTPEESAGRILRGKIGKKNLSKVVKRLDGSLPFDAPATTADLAQDAGVSALHRAMSPNITAITEKQALQDSALKGAVGELSTLADVSPLRAGETIQTGVDKNLQKAIAKRGRETEPLYEALDAVKEGVDLPKTKSFLKKENKFAKGEIKKALSYIQNLITSNKNNPEVLLLQEKTLKKYEGLSKGAKEKIVEEIGISKPIPGELKGALTEITDRLAAAKRGGEKNLARIYKEAKENILADMANIPEEAAARSKYKELSKPVSAVEREPLLKRFVKKDEFTDEFVLSPEKIPEMVLSGTKKNTEALMKQVASSPRMLDTVRGSFVNKLFDEVSLASINASGEQNLSYHKFNRFLNKHKAKLNLVFDKDQVRVLNDARELLKRRNLVQTLGRAAGSNTQSETTLLAELTGSVGRVGGKIIGAVPGGGRVKQIATPVYNKLQDIQKAAIKDVLAEALINPEKAKILLTPAADIKTVNQLENLLGKLSPIAGHHLDDREQ